jgi:hypothetical protein
MAFQVEVTEPRAFINLEPGSYAATVKALEPAEGSFGSRVKFTFSLDDEKAGDGGAVELWAWASQKCNSRTKLFRWATVLLGSPPPIGRPLNLEALVGRPCNLLVDRVDTEDGPRCRIQNVLAPKAGRQAHPMEEPAEERCVECFGPLTYYAADGQPYCSDHGPLDGQVAS